MWRAITFIVGAIIGWLIASAGGLLFGVVFFFPFGLVPEALGLSRGVHYR
jgi:hypothetical protein